MNTQTGKNIFVILPLAMHENNMEGLRLHYKIFDFIEIRQHQQVTSWWFGIDTTAKMWGLDALWAEI